jgi:glycerophosphoryl diester phosphodiesterase
MSVNPWAARRPLLVAHRGGALEAPENTMLAFRSAVACGAQMLEIDLHATADGEIVVIHDPMLDRTTDGSGPVAEQRLADVRALDAAHWFVPGRGAVPAAGPYPLRGVATGAPASPAAERADLRVPTFSAVLEAFPDTWFTMELKADGLHDRTAELLAAHGREEDVLVGGFVAERLAAFRAAAPHIPTSATEPEVAAFWTWAHGAGDPPGPPLPYAALQVPTTYEGVEVVTEAFVARAHDCGIAVHVWTVDEPTEMHRLLDLGVDAIMTDRPSALAGVLAERGAA